MPHLCASAILRALCACNHSCVLLLLYPKNAVRNDGLYPHFADLGRSLVIVNVINSSLYLGHDARQRFLAWHSNSGIPVTGIPVTVATFPFFRITIIVLLFLQPPHFADPLHGSFASPKIVLQCRTSPVSLALTSPTRSGRLSAGVSCSYNIFLKGDIR